MSYFHASNVEVIWLIDFTKATHSKSGAITKAYAACNRKAAAHLHECAVAFASLFLSLRQRSIFSTSQIELHFDKITCWHTHCKIRRRSNVVVLNILHWHLHCLRPSKLTGPKSWVVQKVNGCAKSDNTYTNAEQNFRCPGVILYHKNRKLQNFTTSKNRGPASLLSSDRGDANTFHSSP